VCLSGGVGWCGNCSGYGCPPLRTRRHSTATQRGGVSGGLHHASVLLAGGWPAALSTFGCPEAGRAPRTDSGRSLRSARPTKAALWTAPSRGGCCGSRSHAGVPHPLSRPGRHSATSVRGGVEWWLHRASRADWRGWAVALSSFWTSRGGSRPQDRQWPPLAQQKLGSPSTGTVRTQRYAERAYARPRNNPHAIPCGRIAVSHLGGEGGRGVCQVF
jgi:hypothetical protein